MPFPGLLNIQLWKPGSGAGWILVVDSNDLMAMRMSFQCLARGSGRDLMLMVEPILAVGLLSRKLSESRDS